MNRYYNSLFKNIMNERRIPEYKAWFNPSSNYFRQFSTNGLHSEIAEQEFQMNEAEAIQHGYYRIYMGHELNIDSYSLPTEREFQATKYIIDNNSYKKISATRWNIETKKGFVFFPKLSFFFAESIKDGKLKVFN